LIVKKHPQSRLDQKPTGNREIARNFREAVPMPPLNRTHSSGPGADRAFIDHPLFAFLSANKTSPG